MIEKKTFIGQNGTLCKIWDRSVQQFYRDAATYVNELKYLGIILQANNKMSADCSSKRGKFISKVHSLNQEFNYADPYTILKLYDIYIRDFCGSNIWDLYSADIQRL